MRRARTLVMIGIGAVLTLLAGCQSGPDTSAQHTRPPEEEWSSKPQSVLGRDESMRRIETSEPINPREAATLRIAAVDLLRQAADSTNPLLRANAIEALQKEPDVLVPIVQTALRLTHLHFQPQRQRR